LTQISGIGIMKEMKSPGRAHKRLLRNIDAWFASVRRTQASQMQCGRGCALCCYGLFDISLPDALEVMEGFSKLPDETRAQVAARSAEIQAVIAKAAPELERPFLLSALNEERIDEIVDRAGGQRCPFLGEENQCLIYEHRPLACRLEGAPMVDARDGLFGDWCGLNFTNGVPSDALQDLCQAYYGIQEVEDRCAESLSQARWGRGQSRLTTFIPSLVVEYEAFWLSAFGPMPLRLPERQGSRIRQAPRGNHEMD
jgi:Fe-S-cluster containining protein